MEHPYGFPDLILDRILSFQSGEDLKRSRLVCTKWNEIICNYFLIHKMKICFDSEGGCYHLLSTDDEIGDISKRIYHSTDSFHTVFNHPLQETPFTAFMLKGQEWNVKIFSAVLKAIENSVQELSFKYITLRGKRNFNSHFQFDDFYPKNLTKLYIKSHVFHATEFNVDCDQFPSIQVLVLINCTLIKREKNQIFIKEILFDNVKFNDPSPSALNEIFCFTKANKIVIKRDRDKYLNLVLDLDGHATINTLDITRTPVNKWENCTWEVQNCIVNKLQANNCSPTPFPSCKLMNIKCLTIEDTDIDLSHLPHTIKKLTLIRAKISCSDKIHFEKLESLKLSEEKITSLAYFSDIPTLVNLTLESSLKFNSTELEFNLIPKTVKDLNLTKVKIVESSNLSPCIEGSKKLELDCLTLNNYSFEETEEFMKTVITVQLIISNGYINACGENSESTVEVMEKWKGHVRKFVIGQFFWWEGVIFEKSLLASYVDRKADYYVFQKGKGIGVNADDFFKIK